MQSRRLCVAWFRLLLWVDAKTSQFTHSLWITQGSATSNVLLAVSDRRQRVC